MAKSLHRALIELIEALDYTKDEKVELLNIITGLVNSFKNSDEKQEDKIEKPILGGVCHGFTITWLAAELLLQSAQFRERIERILQDETALQKISEFRAQLKEENPIPDKKLTSELQFWVELLGADTLAFLDSLMSFHQPDKFDDLFNRAFFGQKDYEHISLLTGSDALRERGGIMKLHAQSGIYSGDELIDFFQHIQQTIDNLDDNAPPVIGFLLSNGRHAIGLTYDTTSKKWAFMDINQWPARMAIDQAEQLPVMQKFIVRAFNYDDLDNPYVTFNTAILVLGDDVKQWPHLKTTFNNHYVVTEAIVQRQGFSNLIKLSAWYNYPEIILAAHENHFDLNEQFAEDGNTPLTLACEKSAKEAITALHQCGVDFNKPNRDGVRPAAQAKRKEVLELIARYRANLNRTDSEEHSPLEYAIGAHNATLIPVFKAYDVNLNEPNQSGNTPLHQAVIGNDLPCVEALLIAEVNANIRNEDGQTPLFLAANKKKLRCFVALLNAQSDLEITDDKGNTPLHEAAKNDAADIIIELLKKIDTQYINRLNKQGKTALHIAVWNNEEQIVLLLIQYGADVNLQDAEGDSPLLISLRFNRKLNITLALINAGADVNYTNKRGDTGLHFALRDSNANTVPILQALLEHGANVNQTTAIGEHPVCLAISYSFSTKNLVELLKYDVDLLTRNQSGEIPLLMALKISRRDSQALLICYQCYKFGQLLLGNVLLHNNPKLIVGFLLLTGLAYLRCQPDIQNPTKIFKALNPTDPSSNETLTTSFNFIKK